MKKFILGLLIAVFGILSLMPVFCASNKNKKVSYAADFIENEIADKFDIVSESVSNIPKASASKHNAPLNKETKQMMSGYTFTPNIESTGEQQISFTVQKFTPAENKSVFMWIYFSDTLLYDLTISFGSTSGQKITWKFDSGTLSNLIDKNGIKTVPYGWKLFELQFNDAEIAKEDGTPYGVEFNTMNFNFESPVNITDKVNTEGLSFYHVYMADSYDHTGVIYYQPFSNYELKRSFANTLENIYVDDDLKINGIYDVFEYVVIGKYDLKNYSVLENYTWSITIRNTDGKSVNIKFGDTYTFQKSGYHSINIKLAKIEDTTEEIVLNTSYSVYCDIFGVGAFSNTNYFFDEGTNQVLIFTMADNFVADGEVFVYLDNNRIADVLSVRREDKIFYVTLSSKTDGHTMVTFEVKGHREGFSESETYSSKTNIYINEVTTDNVSMWILWVFFGVFCASLVIFLIISFVKARKFSVK